jgi:hypothetical protein
MPASVAAAGAEVFTGSLNASAEVPSVNELGTGSTTVVIDPTGTSIWYSVTYANLTGPVVAAHIHIGNTSVSGPVSLPLAIGPSPMTGILTVADFKATAAALTFDDALSAIRTGNAYVNLHTAAHPGGEVRAQLFAATNIRAYGGRLSSGAEVPPVSESGSGTFLLVLDDSASHIDYTINYSGLTGPVVAAHIHIGSATVAGPVSIPFVIGPSPMVGTLTAANFKSTPEAPTYADAIVAIRNGNAYVNLHTAAHPGGEVRGQIGDVVSIAAAVGPGATAAPTAQPTLPDVDFDLTPPPTSTVEPAVAPGGTSTSTMLLLLAVGSLVLVGALRLSRRHRS